MIGDSTIADFDDGRIGLRARVRPADGTICLSYFRLIPTEHALSAGVRSLLQMRSSAQLGATEAETQAFLADSTPAAAQRWPLRRRERLRQQREPPSSRVGQLCGAGEISSPELDQRPALRFMARFGPMR
jgi:hypothetical protein